MVETTGQSFARNRVNFLGVIDWIVMLGRKRQRLDDKAAGTVVVKKFS
jgi:hypothetical protein